MTHILIHTSPAFTHNELLSSPKTLIASPYLISVVDVRDGVLKVRKDSLQRTWAEFSMKPLVVEKHVFVQVLEPPRSNQVVRQLTELVKGKGVYLVIEMIDKSFLI